MGLSRALLAALAMLLAAPAAATAATDGGRLEAGVAVVDTTYHVGSSAGQYATTRDSGYGDHDPHFQQGKNQASYGIQSRLTARAIVVRQAGGEKLALLKTELYIPQDLLWRRVAHLLEQRGIGIGRHNLTMSVSHNHSSPYYSSTAWGAWAFQDVLDIRFYETMARRFADAVEQADERLVPVRVSARTGRIDKVHRHSFGGAIADDGTPAGYPQSDSEHVFSVVRFDDVSSPGSPRPLALLLNYSGHPEFLEGNDLISADYLGPLERFVDRETGAVTIFTQNAVGTAEPENSTFHDFRERLEFSHRQYGQAEVAARLLGDAVVGAWKAIGEQRSDGETLVPWTSAAPVAVSGRWFPGPLSHPYPGVSNCRTESAVQGRPGVPVVGLPDCRRIDVSGVFEPARPVLEQTPFGPGLSTEQVRALGIPIPENYSAPSYTGLQETVGIHLQAFRIGDILFTVCSCEQWKDQSRNIQTRTDRIPNNEWIGFDWSSHCEPADGGAWSCPDPRAPAERRLEVPGPEFQRMRAQVRNDATGWNDPEYLPWAESEPAEPERIKGNYTHDDLDTYGGRAQTPEYADRHGYALTVPISMANDYNGYIATYREYQRGDHYRKALTGYGPHSSDYLATRLVRMGQELSGDAAARAELEGEPLGAKEVANQAHADAKAAAIGQVASAALPAYAATLPDDGGAVEVVDQPQDIERFAAAHARWRGGSNYVDDPEVVVERREGDAWAPAGDGTGEVVLTLRYPEASDEASHRTGSFEWLWTATWEAFVGRVPFTDPQGRRMRATPAGTYRFVISGRRREGGETVGYRLASEPFAVRPWSGITVDPAGLDARRPAFRVGPGGLRQGETLRERRDGAPIRVEGPVGPIDYPDSYEGGLVPRFIDDRRTVVRDPDAPEDASRWEWYCLDCSFRPWLDAGDAASVTVTVVARNGRERTVAAEREGDRWVAPVRLRHGERAYVAAGAARDAWGNHNAAQSAPVAG
jgi:hypothetical protein